MELNTFTKPHRYIPCMHCGAGAFMVSHLIHGTRFGPWYCDDCGRSFTGRTVSDGSVEVEPHGGRVVQTLVTLRREPGDGPITLLVRGIQVLDHDEEFDPERDDYFYNEHTCPTNYLAKVEKVIAPDGDEDPHGVFRWVKTELLAPT